METFGLLADGITAALEPSMLVAVFIGITIGLFVGALPGIGPAAAVAILLPTAVGFDGTAAIAALAGVYYGAMFGGAVTSILLGIPGDAPSVMTILDGYPMARQGQAGPALAMNVFSSFFGGLIGLLLMTVFSVHISRAALSFGPTEMAALMVFALSLVTVFSGEDAWKGMASMTLGVWLGTIGFDPIVGLPRFTFSQGHLLDGLDFSIVAVGLFGMGEMFAVVGQKVEDRPTIPPYTFRSLLPRISDIVTCRWDLLRGSLIGFLVGVLPGVGATAATMFAYGTAKRFSKTPERFGQGAIEGVAAPEAANNAASYSAMIPLLTLGIPGSGTTAVLMGGLLMVGLQPGPMLFQQHPEFVWTLFGTFYIGNLALVFVTLALTPVLAATVFIAIALLFPMVIGILLFGVYSINYSFADLWIMLLFGTLGYVMTRISFPIAPLLLGLILGPMLERSVRRTLIASDGDLRVFVEHPLSLAILLITLALVLSPQVKALLERRRLARLRDTTLQRG